MTDEEQKASFLAATTLAATESVHQYFLSLERLLFSHGFGDETLSRSLGIVQGAFAEFMIDHGATYEQIAEFLEGVAQKFRSGQIDADTESTIAAAKGKVPS